MEGEKFKVLIVDDEEVMRSSLMDWLMENNYDPVAVESCDKAVEETRRKYFDAALIDLKLPGLDGIQTMHKLREIQKDLQVVIITAYATVSTAVQAIREGAYDYLPKPFNPDEITSLIQKIIERQKLIKENIFLRKELTRSHRFEDIIGKSDKMQKIFEFVKSIAESKSTILIYGETGTGKELIARAIHNVSGREGEFVPVSCASLPETLLEAELFGCEKGAFTDAKEARTGKLELADRGTLFLDEIGDIVMKVQVDLLRFLQDKKIRRLGGKDLIALEVRIVAATNKNLEEMTRDGRFREDLFYRLNVISISLPPLREKREDIPLLVNHFIEKYNIENRKQVEEIEEDALNILANYSYPGNIRELENIIEHAIVVSKGNLLKEEHLPAYLKAKKASFREELSLEELEGIHISKILEKYNFNIMKSAEILGIDRATLYRKMEKYGIKRSVE